MRFTHGHDVCWGTNGILPRPGAASFKRLLGGPVSIVALDSKGGPNTDSDHSTDEEGDRVPRPSQEPCDDAETTNEACQVQIRLAAEYLVELTSHKTLLRSGRLTDGA